MSLAEKLPLHDARPGSPARADASGARHLFGPISDFMLLGGGSLIIIALVVLLVPKGHEAGLAFTSLLLANVLNHPHFAHSYQIFYRDFRSKAFGRQYSAPLRIRYIAYGIVVPLALAAYFAAAFTTSNTRLFGYGMNLMAFLTGWHYVKQGYGMLMVDAALKRRFFSAFEKNVLLVNAYLCWAMVWFVGNQYVSEKKFWNLDYYTFSFPAPLLWLSIVLAVAGGGAAVAMLARKSLVERQPLPWNGVVSYFVSLYIWLLAREASFAALLIVPAFHSLQYLAVVWRYQLNRERAEAAGRMVDVPLTGGRRLSRGSVNFAIFVLVGTMLGFLGFWGMPLLLDSTPAYDHTLLGPTAFMFAFWIFINVHHYCLDNVMWRRENTDVKTYLFR